MALLTAAIPATPASAANNPRVLPPQSQAFGKSLGEWSAEWWKWAVSVPSPTCGPSASGKVWFLAGTSGNEGTVDRACTVPTGAAILLPVLNAEWSTVEGPCPLETGIPGTSEAALRACARAFAGHVTVLEASVDGAPLRDLDRHRTSSPPFTFAPIVGNAFGLPAGSTQSVSDGFWVLLPPLSPGVHTIAFHGEAFFPEFGGFTFRTSVRYQVTVKPGGR